MIRHVMLILGCLLLSHLILVKSAKQQVQLSDSYLPVAMQVIAHLTDQMAFEAKDEPVKPTTKPTTKPNRPSDTWTKPPGTKPTSSWFKPTTTKPYVFGLSDPDFKPPIDGWWMHYGLMQRHATTVFHKPGLYAPVVPPKPSGRTKIHPKTGFILLPIDHTQYTVLEPQETRTDEPLLSINEDIRPLIEPAKDSSLLPPFDDKARSEDEISDNLQYLSQNVQELIKMANDPDDERPVDVWEGAKGAYHQEATPKGKMSSSNLRLLLLYDLLSREAKRQRLSDYSGFSPDVMKTLVDSSSGGARAQLSLALSKMVDRRDCEHEYANNRAKEMVAELAKDESKLSSELRYLQPLVYTF